MKRSCLQPLLLLSIASAVMFGAPDQAQALCAFQEGCETDTDCGHGFECVHGLGSEEGVQAGECGDDYCDSGETETDCPEDCADYSHCKPVSCEDGGDSDCATDKGYRCDRVFGDDGEYVSECIRPALTFCCETNDDCPRHSFCAIVSDESTSAEGEAGAVGASGQVLGYCEVGDGTFETVTATSSSTSATGSGGTSSISSSSTRADGDSTGSGGSTDTTGGSKHKKKSGGCNFGVADGRGGSGALGLLLGGLLLLLRRPGERSPSGQSARTTAFRCAPQRPPIRG